MISKKIIIAVLFFFSVAYSANCQTKFLCNWVALNNYALVIDTAFKPVNDNGNTDKIKLYNDELQKRCQNLKIEDLPTEYATDEMPMAIRTLKNHNTLLHQIIIRKGDKVEIIREFQRVYDAYNAIVQMIKHKEI